MTDRRPPPNDAQLEAALTDLGRWIDFPPPPDLALAVRARLDPARLDTATRQADDARLVPDYRPLSPRHRLAQRVETLLSRLGLILPLPSMRRLALAGVIGLIVVAIVAIATALPTGTRQVVADRLGLRGVAIRYGWLPEAAKGPGESGDAETAGDPDALGLGLDLGRRVTMNEAQSQIGWPIVRLDAAFWGEPDAVYLDPRAAGGRISLVYRARDDLPAMAGTAVGLVLTQFEGTDANVPIGKFVPERTTIESVRVNDGDGYWIAGAPHPYINYRDTAGRWRQDRIRLAGNTLLWERGDLTLRLESALDRDAALGIAASIR